MSGPVTRKHSSVQPDKWHSRASVTITNGVVEATILEGGGHLARWNFANHSGLPENTLWESPWKTADPGSSAYTDLAAKYDEIGEGRFLATYTGHALCLDGFGPPDPAEAAAGVPLHGEASTVMWRLTQRAENSVAASAELPVAHLRVERKFSLLPGESVLRVDERVTNLHEAPRPLHWVQHATFGPPFASGNARTTASVHQCITWPLDYEGRDLLMRDTEFTWPYAPGAEGKTVDLREFFTRRGTGVVVGAQQVTTKKHGFVAVCNESLRLAIGYVFPVAAFPWLAIWEENCARRSDPWFGEIQARGMEFGTTPLSLGNEAVDARGPLFGTPTSRTIAPHGTLAAPWLLFAATIPEGWHEITDVLAEQDAIVLLHKNQQIRIDAKNITDFLNGNGGAEA